MSPRFIGVLLAFTVVLLTASSARAGSTEPKLLGTFGDWSAYTYVDGESPVCYILSSPKKATGSYKKRGEIFVLVTHRPAEKTRNTFSIMAGYTFKDDSTAVVTIDKQKFALFTHNDSAWAPDAATDTRLAGAMKKGASMVIKGTSTKGTATLDTYGLKGTGAAFDAIDKACPAK